LAIVQISQITNRKGLQIDLPAPLAGAELGWSVDERRLFIGNGTLEEGAPVVGNTEILTEFSDIFAFQTNYTYKGQAAGYIAQTGPTPSSPVSQSLQSWLDQFATVKDFGAVGDGVTDDTAAINRALSQLYCQQANPQIRRSLFFPAGVYKVTGTINIPPFATLYGEGVDNSIIQLADGTGVPYVARTADSLQQVGANIGTNGATPPQYVTIANMGFQSLDPLNSIFLVEAAIKFRFQNVTFLGPLTAGEIPTAPEQSKCIAFSSTPSLICEDITFDGCKFSNTYYGIATDQNLQSITVTNSKFNFFYQGINLTAASGQPGATGFKIMGNMFDNIYVEGIVFGTISLNASGHNIFYDVGNHFLGVTNPASVIIDIQTNNNLSISDLFARTDAYSSTYARIKINNTTSFAMTNSRSFAMGRYVRQTGQTFTLLNNQPATQTIASVSTAQCSAFDVNYTITRTTDAGDAVRTGILTVGSQGTSSSPSVNDDYTQNIDTGITLIVLQSGTVMQVQYISTNETVAFNGTMTYSLTNLG
jgi:hypothetical protein